MRRFRFLLSWVVTLVIYALLVACGSSSRQTPTGQLQSITITPGTASGQAQYTATGTYSDGSKVTPLPALWSVGSPWIGNNIVPKVSLDATGKAACPTIAGTYTIAATAPIDPRVAISKLQPTTPQITGTAVLNCGDLQRQLVSISISPASASGQAQFIATGSYSDGSTVTPLPAVWFPIRAWYKEANPVNFFNLDQSGKASCNGGSGTGGSVTYGVFAVAPVDPTLPLSQMDEFTPQINGSAQLTCP